MSQWINDNKSVYIRTRDLAYNLNCYSNLGVIKADKFRKNLGISNNQSVRREREIFAAESMARQYKIDTLSYKANLCFLVHKLVIEIDEDGHVYYDEEKHQISQILIELLGFIFIRINPDVENFDLDVEYTITSKNRWQNVAEESLKEKFEKELLS